MLIIDANAILRYILCDHIEMANTVNRIITTRVVIVRYEVIAEVVYVLEKVYALPRNELTDGIKIFINLATVEVENKDVLLLALDTFANKRLDFVDCLLYGFSIVCNCDVFTFDKKLNSLLHKR